jgi:hypothetical protein
MVCFFIVGVRVVRIGQFSPVIPLYHLVVAVFDAFGDVGELVELLEGCGRREEVRQDGKRAEAEKKTEKHKQAPHHGK